MVVRLSTRHAGGCSANRTVAPGSDTQSGKDRTHSQRYVQHDHVMIRQILAMCLHVLHPGWRQHILPAVRKYPAVRRDECAVGRAKGEGGGAGTRREHVAETVLFDYLQRPLIIVSDVTIADQHNLLCLEDVANLWQRGYQ